MAVALTAAVSTPALASAGVPATTRVSVAGGGVQGNGPVHDVDLSDDSRYVAFVSSASNLVTGDTNGSPDVFVHDRFTGDTTRVSVTSGGAQVTGPGTGRPRISGDGRVVTFHSEAADLVPGDTNEATDVFVHDRSTGATRRVSVSSAAVQGNAPSLAPDISADGRFVTFQSTATNLVPGDTNNTTAGADPHASDVFVHDRQTGATTRVNVSSATALTEGAQAQPGSVSGGASISGDGTVVVFHSDAANLVAGDTNGTSDIFVHNRAVSTTARVTAPVAGPHSSPSVSADGSAVAFTVSTGTSPAASSVYVYDVGPRASTLAGTKDGTVPDGTSDGGAISADGRLVAFESTADDLVAGDTNGRSDVFVRDRTKGTTRLVSHALDATPGDHASSAPSIDASGRWIAFVSKAADLVAADTNGVSDAFVVDRKNPVTVSIGDATAFEGDATPRAVFTVTLSRASSSPVSVDFATAKGTAKGTDFTARSGTVEFAPGTTVAKIKIHVTPDALVEGTETFTVNLSGATGATIAGSTGLGTIIDDD